jgi:hypothetical protein
LFIGGEGMRDILILFIIIFIFIPIALLSFIAGVMRDVGWG